jgi:hypothetical protein
VADTVVLADALAREGTFVRGIEDTASLTDETASETELQITDNAVFFGSNF